MLVNEHPDAYDAVVLSGSALRMPGSLNSGDLNAPWKAPDATRHRVARRATSRVGRAFLEDPLTTDDAAAEAVRPDRRRAPYRPPAQRTSATTCPCCSWSAATTRSADPRSVHKLADAYRTRSGLTDVTTLVYPGARHEIFNEVVQADVRADLLAWLDPRFPSRD